MERMSRLPGRSIKHFGWGVQRHQLWMAESYLLYREITTYREEVKRYYYQDIQAIVSTPTNNWRQCTIMTGLLLAFLALVAALAAYFGGTFAFVLAWIAATITLAILLGNLVLGPTCATTLYTATAEAPLYSLGRKRSTEKAIARLLVFIEAAQRDVVIDVAEAPEVPVEVPAEASAESPYNVEG